MCESFIRLVGRFFLLAGLFFILVGCSQSPIENYINSKWPPISVDQHRAKAQENLSNSLQSIQYPTIAFGLDLKEAANALLTDDARKKGLSNLKLTTEKQLVKAVVKFDASIPDLSKDKTIAALEPKITGELQVYLGVTSEFDEKNNIVTIGLLPNLNAITIESIRLKGDYDVTLIGNLIANLLNNYADNVVGELSRANLLSIDIPASYTKTVLLSEVLEQPEPDKGISVTFTDKPIKPPFTFTGITTLAHRNQLKGMIELYDRSLFEVEASKDDSLSGDSNYDALVQKYEMLESDVFLERRGASPAWLGVRKDLISHLVNTALNQAQLCFNINADTLDKTHQKIPLPDGAGIDCRSMRDCRQTRNCSFKASHDTRNCHRCLVRNVFTGGCSVRGNDPICELAKAAQNKIYEADAAAKKLDCERLKAQKKLACEVEKQVEKNLCEAKKGVIEVIGKTGNFANIETNTTIKGKSQFCITNTTLDATLSNLNSSIRVSGNADVNVNFKFTPLDIVGHLTCPFPWTEEVSVNAKILDQSIPFNAALTLAGDEGKVTYAYTIKEMSIIAEFNPRPAELVVNVLDSINMNMACPVVGVAGKTVSVPLRPFIPVLPETHTFTSEAIEDGNEVEIPSVQIGGRPMSVNVSFEEQVIILSLAHK